MFHRRRNVVCSVNLGCRLDLKSIAQQALNAEYNPRRFHAVSLRIRDPKTTAHILDSGNMVITEAKSEQQSKLAAVKFARIIQKFGFPAKVKDFKIQNIDGFCDVKFPIRLECLAHSYHDFSSYEPELYPYLIYEMKQPKIALMIYECGKIIFTGAKVLDEIHTAFENIYPILAEFRKTERWNGPYLHEEHEMIIKFSEGQQDIDCHARQPNFKSDHVKFLSQMMHQEKRLLHKRRWLMGVAVSRSKKEKFQELLKNKIEPESLLRKDDLFYDNIRDLLGKRLGTSSSKMGELRNALINDRPFKLHGIVEILLSLLDALNNKELYSVAKILSGGSVRFEKTRKKMKILIREHLSKISDHQQKELLAAAMTSLTAASQCRHADVLWYLDRLEERCPYTLHAMHRRLKGTPGRMPQLRPPKSGWSRGRVVKLVRKACLNFLSKLAEGDELQEPLAKAMAVARLSVKLDSGQRMPFDATFYQYTPEKEALQREVTKAIWLLDKKIRAPELKRLQLVLDPNAELSIKSLRSAIRKLLTEYLFECGDVDPISKPITEALTIINKSSIRPGRLCLSDKGIEEEVEGLLRVSADMKQILWDLLPDCGFHKDYEDAYMDDLEVSENSDNSDNGSYSSDVDDMSESFGESNPAEGNRSSQPGVPTLNGHSVNHEAHMESDPMCCPNSIPSNSSQKKSSSTPKEESTSRNKYLGLQEVCDRASVAARCVIGHTLELCARAAGLDLDLDAESYLRCPEGQAVEELVPLFPESKLDKLKELMGLE